MNGRTISPRSLLHRVQWVFLIVSIIPLMVLTYICVQYVFPRLGEQGQSVIIWSISITIGLTVLLSVLGYIISRKSTMTTIRTIEDTSRRQSDLLDVANKLSRTTQTDTVFTEATRSAVDLLEADAGLLYMEEANRLVCKHAEGVALPGTEKVVCEMGEGLAGFAARERKTVRTQHAGKDRRFTDQLARLIGFEAGSALSYPMVYQDRLIGVLEVLRKAGQEEFGDPDQQIIEMLGQQTAATIMNAEFHGAQQNFFTHVTELLRLAMEKTILWEGHLHNVTSYCNLISRKLNLDEDIRREIHFAAALHDVGFLEIGPVVGLAEIEEFRERLREHPVLGAQLIEPIMVWKNVAPLILHHHEACNGSGYPGGLRKDEIPLGSRIICVAEAFDTMVNPASYASTKTKAEAMAELETYSGTRYDEKVVEAFLEVLKVEEEF